VDTVYALKDQVKGLANHMSSVLKRLDTEEGHRAALQAAINSLIAAKSAPETTSTEGKKDSSALSASD
jgi:betaPIX coiled coil